MQSSLTNTQNDVFPKENHIFLLERLNWKVVCETEGKRARKHTAITCIFLLRNFFRGKQVVLLETIFWFGFTISLVFGIVLVQKVLVNQIRHLEFVAFTVHGVKVHHLVCHDMWVQLVWGGDTHTQSPVDFLKVNGVQHQTMLPQWCFQKPCPTLHLVVMEFIHTSVQFDVLCVMIRRLEDKKGWKHVCRVPTGSRLFHQQLSA